jgi:hypothetical protein
MNAPFLSGGPAPSDPFQGARLTTAAPAADPYADLLARWRNVHAAVHAAIRRRRLAGYERACRHLIDEVEKLDKVEDSLIKAIMAGPATAAGIAAKIEVAVAFLSPDELGTELVLVAKFDAERIAGGVA